MAASFNTDSMAMASTRPRLCSIADARRVPNSMANAAIAMATYSALSCQAGVVNSLPRVIKPWLMATAFSCKAR